MVAALDRRQRARMDGSRMIRSDDIDRPAVWRFLLLTLALSIPFWGLAAVVQTEPLPGLPLSGLMAFCPALAGGLLAARGGRRPVAAFFAQAWDAARIRGHAGWAWLILLMPVLALASFLLQRQGGLPAASGPPAWAPFAMLVVFLVAGLGEELGWSGWLIGPLARLCGERRAALILGVLWAAWHLLPFVQADRSWDWIAWQCGKTVAVRVVMVRLYFGAGRSVFAVALFHALDNVAAFLLPFYGAVYDPRLAAILTIVAAVAVSLRRRPARRP